MLGYKLRKIYRSNANYDYEADAIILINLEKLYSVGKVFFIEDIKDQSLIPVKAVYRDPETGLLKEVEL